MRQIIVLLFLFFPVLKPTLHANDKKILAVGVTIQVFASIAHVYTNETGPSNSNYLYLTLALLLVDFMSFTMVFIRIFSSIKTIKEAAKRNETAARDLGKMRLLAYFNGCVVVFWRMKWFVWLSVSGFSSILSEDCGLECMIVTIEQTVALGFYIGMFYLFWPQKQNEYFIVQDEEKALSTIRGEYVQI